MGPTLATLVEHLKSRQITSRELTENCLQRIDDETGEGGRAFVLVDHEAALAQADAMDLLRAKGAAPSPFAGIPISIKDLFDVAGQVTRAGSAALDDAPPATADAPTIARLRRRGFVFVGRTNMSEFAFSGVGLNPHYGTPANAWARHENRIPGGSSSGAAISVTDSMAHAAIGTDTGGSCRIPAAFNGLVGYKPTARRVPLDGAVPLSGNLDSIGPLARSVACCAALDAILSGDAEPDLGAAPMEGLRLAVPKNYVFDGADETVARAFERAMGTLSKAGARIIEIIVPAFETLPGINAKGGFAAADAYAWHRDLLGRRGAHYDPRVRVRIERGALQTAADYVDLLQARQRFVADIERAFAPYDAMMWPTVPTIAPRLSELDDDQDFARLNLLALRNPTLVNFFDGCAISLPMQRQGEAPSGLMLSATANRDHRLMAVAASVEAALRVET